MPTTTLRRNRYAAPCRRCGQSVPAEGGSLLRDGSTWVVEHIDECPPTTDTVTAAARAAVDGPRAVDVPAGHYATPSRTGNNDLDFWRVDRPTEGRWAGRTFVKRMIGGHPDTPVRGSEAHAALAAIADYGIERSATLYGTEIGRCYVCNRTLTDETSRALGIGPDCRGRRVTVASIDCSDPDCVLCGEVGGRGDDLPAPVAAPVDVCSGSDECCCSKCGE